MIEFLGFQLDADALLASLRDFVLPRLATSALQLLAVGLTYWVARWLLRKVERRITSRTKTNLDDIVMLALSRCVLLSIAFWGAWRLAYIWELPGVAGFIVAIWIVAFALPVSRFLTDLLKVLEERFVSSTETRIDDTALPWINRGVQVLVIGIAVMIALHQLGINITPFLAGASVAGLAVSLAAKDTLANLIAGILLVIDRPFVVGDRIELWSSPAQQSSWGDVVEVGIRATKIRTPDNIVVIIPNSVIMQRDIVNWTASGDNIRLRIPIGIAYNADTEKAKEVCLTLARSCEDVLESPEPVCIIRSFGESSIDLELRVWIRDARQRRAAGDWITDRVKKAFDEHGIEIPFPQRDLYIKSMPGEEPAGASPFPPSESRG